MEYLEKIFKKEQADRKNNKLRALIKAVWEKECVTRKELAEQLNVSKVSVRNDTEKLLKYKALEECNPQKGGVGRRPTPLKLNPDLFYSYGIYARRRTLNLSLLDANSNIIESYICPNDFAHAENAYDHICEQIQNITTQRDLPRERFAGLGISIPGILNTEKNAFLASSAFPDDKNCDIVKTIKRRLGDIPVYLTNDANLLAICEHKWGNAKNMSDFLYFTCGYGMGIFMNGQICAGHQGAAGEVSFMQLAMSGERGADGRRGTLISLKRFSDIPLAIQSAINEGGSSLAKKYLTQENPEVTFDIALKAAQNGDILSRRIFSEYFEVIGDAVLNLAYIFNPEAIFLDDWTSLCPEATIDVIKQKMMHYEIHTCQLSCKIAPGKLGKDDLSRGAATLPLAEYFNMTER